MNGILAPQDDMILEAYAAAGFENLSVEKELGELAKVSAWRILVIISETIADLAAAFLSAQEYLSMNIVARARKRRFPT